MKDIKYRIWDTQLNKYWYELPQKYHIEFPRFIPEQYTGIDDKNGKEIYFLSDIVRATVTDDLTGEVRLLDGVIYLCLKTYKIVMRGHEEFNLIFAEELEIIGNIHK